MTDNQLCMKRKSESSAFAKMDVFLEVAERGSFSAAGRGMGLSPSSVSRQIDGLEQELGVRLFQRTTRALHLTEAGEVLLGRAGGLMAELQQLQLELGRHAREPHGLLRISTSLTLGRMVLAPALPRLLTRHPKLKVELSMSNRLVEPVSEGFDLVVRLSRLRDSSLVARKLADHQRVLVASPAYLERRGRPRRLSELSNHECLHYRYDSGGSAWRFRRGDQERRVQVSGCFAADNADALLEVCLQGMGITLLPYWMVADRLEQGALVRVLPGFQATATAFDPGIYALYPSSTRVPAKLRATLDFLIELFSQPPWSRPAGPGH